MHVVTDVCMRSQMYAAPGGEACEVFAPLEERDIILEGQSIQYELRHADYLHHRHAPQTAGHHILDLVQIGVRRTDVLVHGRGLLQSLENLMMQLMSNTHTGGLMQQQPVSHRGTDAAAASVTYGGG